jgi:carboxyl-terminal processing protease
MKALLNKDRKTLRLGFLFACLLVLCLTSSLLPPVYSARERRESDYALTDTRQGRLAVFDDVWETIDERYYDPYFGGTDWNGARTAFRLAAADAHSSQELYDVLRRMVRSLNDPHTRVYSPAEKSDWWNPRFVSLGLAVREVEGVPTVVQVDPKSAAAQSSIRAGDEIDSVDGVSVATLIKQKLGTARVLNVRRSEVLRAASLVLEGEAGTFARLSWKNREGKFKSAILRRYWTQRILSFDMSRRNGILVINLQGFTQSLASDLVRAFKEESRDARGVVLDLRENGGGDADAMAEIAALFLGEGVSLGAFTDRAGATLQLISHSKSAITGERKDTRLPLVVLVSERTSSAAEILAAVLQARGRAQLIGATTCGCVLAIRSRHSLPDDGLLDVSEFDYRTSEGVRLEGRGVKPEIMLDPIRRDIYANRDRLRDAALQILSGKPL